MAIMSLRRSPPNEGLALSHRLGWLNGRRRILPAARTLLRAKVRDLNQPQQLAISMPGAVRLFRAIGVRQVRIACGLILFSYLLSHFANHALGNISLAAMEDGLDYHMRFWRDPVVTTVFYTAAIVHWGLGLWALYERRQFRYPVRELTQLVLGLSIPFLLVIHFVGVRLQAPLFGRDLYYAQAFIAYWVTRPYIHWIQFTLLLVAWTHGCIG